MKILHFNYSLISAKATRVYIYTHTTGYSF